MFFRPAKISQTILSDSDKEKTDSFKLALKMVGMRNLFLIFYNFLHLKKHVHGMNPE
jgi:hypothetical protein